MDGEMSTWRKPRGWWKKRGTATGQRGDQRGRKEESKPRRHSGGRCPGALQSPSHLNFTATFEVDALSLFYRSRYRVRDLTWLRCY